MGAALRFFLLVHLLCTHVSCLELPSQVIKSSNCLEIDPSPSPIRFGTLSLENLSEVKGDGLESLSKSSEASSSSSPHIEDGNQQQPKGNDASRTSKLSAAAEPFIPSNHARMLEAPDLMTGSAVTLYPAFGPFAPMPTDAALAAYLTPNEYIQSQLFGIITRGLKRARRTVLPSSAVEEFPQREKLLMWFETIALEEFTTQRGIWSRKRFLDRITGYKTPFGPLHGLSISDLSNCPEQDNRLSIGENQNALEEGFWAAYEFGYQVLDAHVQRKLRRVAQFSFQMNKRLLGMSSIGEHQRDNLFYLPIILAAAKEEILLEAARFSGYLHAVRPKSKNLFQQFPTLTKKELRDLTFETIAAKRKPELECLGIIVYDVKNEKEMDEWMKNVKRICDDGAYHEINLKVEALSHSRFEDQTKEKDADQIQISENQSVLSAYHQGSLDLKVNHLAEVALANQKKRHESPMLYGLAKDCLDHFPQKLYDIAKEITATDETMEDSTKIIVKFLKQVYGSAATMAGYY